jgi:FkbM family methyltransferase
MYSIYLYDKNRSIKMSNKTSDIIIEIGSYNGLDGMTYAICNPRYLVYSFEPNPYQFKKIINNKKIIEKKLDFKIKNFKIINKAISNFNGKSKFYISSSPESNSIIKFKSKKKILKEWKGNIGVKNFHVKKKIITNVVRLEDFFGKTNKIEIKYLHCDAQGSDLKALKSLGKFLNSLHGGSIEVATNFKKSMYSEKSNNINKAKKILKEEKYKIINIQKNDIKANEVNIFFEKKKNSLSILNKIKILNRFIRGFLRRIKDQEDSLFYLIIFNLLIKICTKLKI